ncbi:MAG: maleylpyruvate isomerase family mycothiol-dependent enzyme [Jatrophihabitans sp.]|uniref:maleylpyruvate isomerase family mycothiol-dependent enzyme n=1 Tax=Jatrophihabitans sp. TaxID=1932789 RepID=UPI0039121C0A
MPVNYHLVIRREMDRFVSVLRDTDPSAPVPSCPDWTAHDLLDHMTGVALFWGAIVRDRLTDEGPAEAAEASRPAEHDALFAAIEAATADLLASLDRTPDDVPVWTWSEDNTVGFIRRRMAHEALIHRLDAELAAGAVTEVDADLAADGVQEAFEHFFGGFPAWSTHTSDGPVALVRARDTGAEWLVRIGYFSGLSPNTGKTYDREPTLELVGSGEPSCSVTGTAGELDAWLWSRPAFAAPVVEGDPSAFEAFRAIIAKGVN